MSPLEKVESLISDALEDWARLREKRNLTDDMVAYGNKILADARLDRDGST